MQKLIPSHIYGVQFHFNIRAVRSPQAYRSRAYLTDGGAISGFGNTQVEAYESMCRKIANYAGIKHQAEYVKNYEAK